MKRSNNIIERIERNIAYEPNTGCWLWLAGTNKFGHGRISFTGRPHMVHRIMYESKFGKIPKGLHSLHHCDTPQCVNPDHLYLGTQRDNNNDRDKRGRCTKGQEHYKSKFDSLQIRVIKSLKGLLTGRSIAMYFKVKENTISGIINNKQWKHIKLYETIK